eukprot:3345937-Amphidinium_carterae.1
MCFITFIGLVGCLPCNDFRAHILAFAQHKQGEEDDHDCEEAFLWPMALVSLQWAAMRIRTVIIIMHSE